MKVFARRYDNGEPICLEIEQGRIAGAATSSTQEQPGQSLPWIAPAFLDLQVNGHGGQEFSAADLTPEKVAVIAKSMDPLGVARFCPTVTTNSRAVIEHSLRTIATACETSPETAARIAGIHLEGPYLTKEPGPRGAHPVEHCREPDWDEFRQWQDAAGGRIVIHTTSVEFEGSPGFVRQVAASGVLVSIGHTAATPQRIREGVDAGARMSTHLGNGSHPFLPRHRNYIWAQLADDRLAAGLIVDGHHLPADVVKTFVRAKTPARCVLVSDMSGMAGLPAGRYETNLCDLEILASGKIVVAGQRELLAGASAPIGTGVANVVRFAGVDLAEAVRMAVHHPAALLGLTPGGLEPGCPADLVLFDWAEPDEATGVSGLDIRVTIRGGEIVHGEPVPAPPASGPPVA